MGVLYSPKIVQDGLVLMLDAANPKSYPGSGTTWNDLSGNGNHATGTGISFNSNGYFLFDGTRYFTLPNPVKNFNVENNPVSLGVWLRPTSTGDVFSDNYTEWGIRYISSTNLLYYYCYSAITKSHPTNTWVYAVVNHTTNTGAGTFNMSAYYNGEFVNSTTGSTGNGLNDNPFIIGGDYQGGTIDTSLNGNIASVHLYQKELTAEEVLQNYNATKSRYNL